MGVAREVVAGAVAGLGGTLAMSVVMLAAQRAGLMGTLPPKRITERALEGLHLRSSGGTVNAMAAGAHLGYGMAAGAAFGQIGKRLCLALPSGIKGAVFGTVLWAASYFGWVPALGLMPPPPKDRPGRPGSMLLAHIVFGAVLGLLSRGPASIANER